MGEEDTAPPAGSPRASIIVPAHNEQESIEAVVEDLNDLTHPDYEVIVVNDGSTDQTAEILNRLSAQHAE